MNRIVVLASGRGSNFESIARAVRSRALSLEIAGVVTDVAGASVLEKAKAYDVAGVEVPRAEGLSRVEHERRVLEALDSMKPDFLVLAGYMRVLSAEFIERYRSKRGTTRIVNVHPSLLPAFAGVGSYRQAFDYGCKIAGVTVHLVEPEVDTGPICAQEAFSIADCLTPEEVETRGLRVEHRLYPEVLAWVVPEKWRVEKSSTGRLRVRPS